MTYAMESAYYRLDMHVYASNLEVIRAARRRIKRSARCSRAFRLQRHRYYRAMLTHHAEARELVRHFAL